MAGLFGKNQTIASTQTKIGTMRVQNSSQGFPVPLVYGKTRITSNLLWFGDFTAIPHTSSQKQGGKGGGSTTTSNTTYTYTCAAIFGLCEGPVSAPSFIGTVWSNKVVTSPAKLGLSQFQGDYAQTPWTYLTTNHSNQALNYRGDCYAAVAALDLGSSDGLPNLSFEISGLLASADVNPADVISDFLTNDKYGAGWPAPHLGDLSNFRTYCAQAGFFISPAWVSQTPASQILTELVQIGNAAVIWSDDLLKIVPYADTTVGTWVPDLTVQYQLGYSDFIITSLGQEPVTLDRKRQADAFNAVKLEVLNRANQYNTHVVEAKDQLAIDLYGLRPMQQVSAHPICDANIARSVAQTILQRELYVRNTYTFTLGWKYARLEPMDIVGITDASLNLVQQPVRIVSITEDEHGFLLMTAEELNVGVGTPGSYATQPTNGASPSNSTPPGNAVAPVIFQPPLALSGSPQIWLGTAGGPNWGGAQVWASVDNTTFEQVGVAQSAARFGTLTANLGAVADPDTTSTLAVDLTTSNGALTAAANSVADALGTLSYVAGANAAGQELVAYSNVTLTSAYHYSMGGYIRRAQAGSTLGAHLAGATFMRLDQSVAAFNVAQSYFGKTIYIKLLSYNPTGGALQALADVSAYTFNVGTQVVTSGNGYPYTADRLSTAGNAATGTMRFNNASQAAASQVYFNVTTAQGANVAAFFTSLGSVGFMDLRDPADTNKWATFTVTGANQAVGVQTFNTTYKAGGAEFPNGDTVVATFSPTPPSGVTSVGLSMPLQFTVANTPVTAAGTLNVSWANVAAGQFLAGPSAGNASAPTFRSLQLADIPAGANGQVLFTSNGVAAWANITAGGNLTNPMTAAGDLIVGGANGVATRLAAGSNNYVLTMVANVPAWAPAPTGSGGGTVKVTAANVSLGSQNAAQTVFTYTSIAAIAARGLSSLFSVSSDVATAFDIVVRGQGNDAGSLWLQAENVGQSYSMTIPFYYENDAAAQNLYVGIKNRGRLSANFTLNNLRMEKFA